MYDCDVFALAIWRAAAARQLRELADLQATGNARLITCTGRSDARPNHRRASEGECAITDAAAARDADMQQQEAIMVV